MIYRRGILRITSNGETDSSIIDKFIMMSSLVGSSSRPLLFGRLSILKRCQRQESDGVMTIGAQF